MVIKRKSKGKRKGKSRERKKKINTLLQHARRIKILFPTLNSKPYFSHRLLSFPSFLITKKIKDFVKKKALAGFIRMKERGRERTGSLSPSSTMRMERSVSCFRKEEKRRKQSPKDPTTPPGGSLVFFFFSFLIIPSFRPLEGQQRQQRQRSLPHLQNLLWRRQTRRPGAQACTCPLTTTTTRKRRATTPGLSSRSF